MKLLATFLRDTSYYKAPSNVANFAQSMQRLSVAKSVKAMATEAVAVHRQKQSVREELSRLQQFESEAEDVNDNFSKWMEKVLAQSDAYVVKFAQVISLKHPAKPFLMAQPMRSQQHSEASGVLAHWWEQW